MLRRLVLLALVAAVLLVADLVAEQRAEQTVAAAVESRVERVGSVDAAIMSFPFLGRLGATGEVSQLRLHLREVAEQGVEVEVLTVDARGIRLSRAVLLGESRVRITDVDTVTATLRVADDEVRRVTGGMVLPDGPVTVPAALAPIVAATELLPCEPQVRIAAGAVVASCAADRLPRIVVDAIGSAELRG